MKRASILLAFLGGFWLLLSGHLTPLLLLLGGISCLLVWIISERMNLVDHAEHPLHLHPVRLVSYMYWLVWQVVQSNIDVAKRIVHPKLPIKPQLLTVRTSQRMELGQVIYANSITLTPGTVSINLEGHEIEVHALALDPASSLLTGEMDRRIRLIEHPQPDDPKAGQQ